MLPLRPAGVAALLVFTGGCTGHRPMTDREKAEFYRHLARRRKPLKEVLKPVYVAVSGNHFTDESMKRGNAIATVHAITAAMKVLARIAEILQSADPERALTILETALAHDPYHEAVYHKIMHIQAGPGRPTPHAARRTEQLVQTLWGSKTGYRQLTCEFASRDGQDVAGSRPCDGSHAVPDVHPHGRVDGADRSLIGVEGTPSCWCRARKSRCCGASTRGRGRTGPTGRSLPP